MVRGMSVIRKAPIKSSQNQFDVVVIGAGINGAGIARDAAMRGLKVLLLDKGDIGGGTSSWSTRLIHGGLRYLEHGEFGLVRESLRERANLLNIAPHLVRPLPILVPIYKNSRRGPWTIRAGMFAYDMLSLGKALPRYRMLSRDETLEEASGLEPDGLVGAAVHYDAQVEFAERLVLENAIAAVENGAEVVTYARVDEFGIEAGMVRRIDFTNELTGTRQSVQSKIVINSAGPWVDQLLEKTETRAARLIGGTKGSHIVVAPFSGAPATAVYVEAKTDQRPFFIIPWNGNYLIGTTDIRYSGNLDQVEIGVEEVDYLLSETNRVIPTANLDRKKILYTYSGVRPLPFTNDKDEQSITRRHFIRQQPQLHNLLSIVGGKLTTYRSLAEETVDMVFRKLEQARPECTTDRQPLPGANTSDLDEFGKDFKQHCGLPEAISDRLLRVYGVRAAEVLELTVADPFLVEVFDDETQAIAAEVIYAFRNEMAQTLADCLLRRTMVGLNSTCGLNAVELAARIAQKHLGWSESRVAEEVSSYRSTSRGSA
jgi:glycerol-3-phosphate dehydrogenase